MLIIVNKSKYERKETPPGVFFRWQIAAGAASISGAAFILRKAWRRMHGMKIPIKDIKVGAGRREARPDEIRKLADSIAEVGLLNPVTVDREHTLIAGRHRLEAAKLLGWTEIECTVSDLEGVAAELAEIDENFARTNASTIEIGEMLKRRKRLYETLHPETKAGVA